MFMLTSKLDQTLLRQGSLDMTDQPTREITREGSLNRKDISAIALGQTSSRYFTQGGTPN